MMKTIKVVLEIQVLDDLHCCNLKGKGCAFAMPDWNENNYNGMYCDKDWQKGTTKKQPILKSDKGGFKRTKECIDSELK